jgi:hypothetical protein
MEPMTVASLASLAVLCVLGLRKLVLMDGLLELRAVVLTALLWAALFALFVLAIPPSSSDCVIFIDG